MSSKDEFKVIQCLIEYQNALETDTYEDDDTAANQFNSLILNVKDPERRKELKNAFNAIMDAQTKSALGKFSEALKGSNSLLNSLEMGRRIVQQQETGLFFPVAAAHLTCISDSLALLKSSADAVIQSTGSLQGQFEKSDLQGIMNATEKTKDDVGNLIEQLNNIYNQLS